MEWQCTCSWIKPDNPLKSRITSSLCELKIKITVLSDTWMPLFSLFCESFSKPIAHLHCFYAYKLQSAGWTIYNVLNITILNAALTKFIKAYYKKKWLHWSKGLLLSVPSILLAVFNYEIKYWSNTAIMQVTNFYLVLLMPSRSCRSHDSQQN